MFKTPQEWSDAFKSLAPQIHFNKNGYEILTQLLDMAKDQVWNEYEHKFGEWSAKVERDGDEVVTKVKMPTVPGIEQVLEHADKLYEFVNQKKA